MPWNHTLEVQFVFAIEPRTQSNVCKFESEIVYLVQKQYKFQTKWIRQGWTPTGSKPKYKQP